MGPPLIFDFDDFERHQPHARGCSSNPTDLCVDACRLLFRVVHAGIWYIIACNFFGFSMQINYPSRARVRIYVEKKNLEKIVKKCGSQRLVINSLFDPFNIFSRKCQDLQNHVVLNDLLYFLYFISVICQLIVYFLHFQLLSSILLSTWQPHPDTFSADLTKI